MAAQVTLDISETGVNPFEALVNGIIGLQEWLRAQGFPPGYTISLSTDGVLLDSTRFTDPLVSHMYQECTIELEPRQVQSTRYPDEVTSYTGQAVYLCKTLRRRQGAHRRLEYLFDLGYLLLAKMEEDEIVDLRHLLGWTRRQFQEKMRTAKRVHQLYALCGRYRISRSYHVNPNRLQEMKECDFNTLIQDIIAHQSITCPITTPTIPALTIEDFFSDCTF